MTKKIILPLLALVAGVALYIVVKKPQGMSESLPVLAATVEAQKASEAPPAAVTSPAPAAPTPANTFAKKLETIHITDLKTVREEVAANPHETPESVLSSAVQLGLLYDAVSSDAEGSLFLNKMKECSGADAEVPASVQTLCLKYTQKISEKFPQLKEQALQVRAQASAAIKLEGLSRLKK